MLNYNELKPGKYIVFDGQPCVIIDFKFLRMQQRKPVAQTKFKNLISGKITEKNFQQSDKFDEADIENKAIKYLYTDKSARRGSGDDGINIWFCDEKNPKNRFSLKESVVGEGIKFVKENSVVNALSFNDLIIGVEIPVKVDLVVTEAAPAVKGNTAQGASKQITLESGAKINTPLFIEEGDIVRVNTENGEYVERVGKK